MREDNILPFPVGFTGESEQQRCWAGLKTTAPYALYRPAKNRVAYSVTIEGINFDCVMYKDPVLIAHRDNQYLGNVALGVAAVNEYAKRRAICKYGSTGQPRIDVSTLTPEGLAQLNEHFGVGLDGISFQQDFMRATVRKHMQEWVKKHPKLSVEIPGTTVYLGGWLVDE